MLREHESTAPPTVRGTVLEWPGSRVAGSLVDGSSFGNDGFQKQLFGVAGYSGNAGQFSSMAKCGVLHNDSLAPQQGLPEDEQPQVRQHQ